MCRQSNETVLFGRSSLFPLARYSKLISSTVKQDIFIPVSVPLDLVKAVDSLPKIGDWAEDGFRVTARDLQEVPRNWWRRLTRKPWLYILTTTYERQLPGDEMAYCEGE